MIMELIIETNNPEHRKNRQTQRPNAEFFSPIEAVITGGFGCCRFRVQLGCIQGGRVQLFTQRIQWLAIHDRPVGMKAVHLILAFLRWRGPGRGELCWGLWLRLGLLFLLGLEAEISSLFYLIISVRISASAWTKISETGTQPELNIWRKFSEQLRS